MCLAVIGLAVVFFLCLTGLNLGASATNEITDDEIVTALQQSSDFINAGKLDEAIALLEPLAPVAGDRLFYLPAKASDSWPDDLPLPEPLPTSVYQCLGAAYWGKRDAARALPYLEVVASRIPPGQNSLIPGTVIACREKLIKQGKSAAPAAMINRRSFSMGTMRDNTLLLPAERVAQVVNGKIAKIEHSDKWRFSHGQRNIVLSKTLSSDLAHNDLDISLQVSIIDGSIMVPARALAEALGGSVSWDAKLKIAHIAVPPKASES